MGRREEVQERIRRAEAQAALALRIVGEERVRREERDPGAGLTVADIRREEARQNHL